jgi:hypothetical protein
MQPEDYLSISDKFRDQKELSLLAGIVGLSSGVPVDYQHCVRLDLIVSNCFQTRWKSIESEFQRQPRRLLGRFCTPEYLSEKLYNHYLLLHYGICALASRHREKWLSQARWCCICCICHILLHLPDFTQVDPWTNSRRLHACNQSFRTEIFLQAT